MKKALGLAAFAAILLMTPSFATADASIITQGDFAVLYAQHARLDPEAAWTVESAIDALVDLGIEPLDGWSADAELTEGTMVLLLRFLDIPVFTPDPDRMVTVNEARAMFGRFERLLIQHLPALQTLTMQTATTHSVRGVAHPVGSP